MVAFQSVEGVVFVCRHQLTTTPHTQAIAFMLADMATGIEASRLLAYRAATMYDQGQRNTHIASMAKLFASEHCHKVVSDAVQIFGGYG